MLLVDFNLAEHLEDETRATGKQINRMVSCVGTPLYIARAVERGGPVPPVFTLVPVIPDSPDIYASAHPDRLEKFPSGQAKLAIDPDDLDLSQHHSWRHELNHDAESVFWLLLHWAMVVQPERTSKEKIDSGTWGLLNGNHESRQTLLLKQTLLRGEISSTNVTHPFYEPLRPLIKDLAAILLNDSHWLPASDPRRDRFYTTEAFQRLILNFIINNSGKEFMDRRVTKTLRKVHRVQASHASSFSFFQSKQSYDAASRDCVNSVGCVCGSMDSCPFLLLFLQGTDNGKMDSSQ
jgi:hypothetical protein